MRSFHPILFKSATLLRILSKLPWLLLQLTLLVMLSFYLSQAEYKPIKLGVILIKPTSENSCIEHQDRGGSVRARQVDYHGYSVACLIKHIHLSSLTTAAQRVGRNRSIVAPKVAFVEYF